MAAAANTLLTTATDVGAGSSVDLTVAKSQVSMAVVVNGTVTGGVVVLEASHDNTNWVKVGSVGPMATGTNRSCQLANGVYRYFRAHIVTAITGGGSVSATLMEAG